jgi:hypothetical protein
MIRMIKSRWKSKFARFVLGYARREPKDARGHVIGGPTLLAQRLGIRRPFITGFAARRRLVRYTLQSSSALLQNVA